MPSADLVLLTEDRYESPTQVDWYVGNILQEDGLVASELERQGLRVERVSWRRSDYDWSAPRAVVFRTTWDYFERFSEFSRWLASVEGGARLINSAAQVRWNADKHYLADLERAGVAIPPTRFIEPGMNADLAEHVRASGWSELVLKPAVSGAARHTYRFAAKDASRHEAVFRQLLASEAWMLQPFQESVLTQGELSLIVVGGRCTHAVRKIAKPGDFRVQDDHGGTVAPYRPTPDEIAFGERAVAACQPLPAYARVDLVRDRRGQLAVMELELIEPEMFFRFHPPAAVAFAQEIVRRMRAE